MTISKLFGVAGLITLAYHGSAQAVPISEFRVSLPSAQALVSGPSIPTKCTLVDGDVYVFINHYPTGRRDFIESISSKNYLKAVELLLTLPDCNNINYFE